MRNPASSTPPNVEDPGSPAPSKAPTRTVALLVWIFPLLFSIQWIVVAALTPFFGGLWDSFGAKLPAATQFMFNYWILVMIAGLVPPAVTLKIALQDEQSCSVPVSLTIGFCCLLIAQVITAIQLFPLFQLSAVAGNT